MEVEQLSHLAMEQTKRFCDDQAFTPFQLAYI